MQMTQVGCKLKMTHLQGDRTEPEAEYVIHHCLVQKQAYIRHSLYTEYLLAASLYNQ